MSQTELDQKRANLHYCILSFFNLELLPPELHKKLSEASMSKEELLGSAGYLLALCPKNPWRKDLALAIQEFQATLWPLTK